MSRAENHRRFAAYGGHVEACVQCKAPGRTYRFGRCKTGQRLFDQWMHGCEPAQRSIQFGGRCAP